MTFTRREAPHSTLNTRIIRLNLKSYAFAFIGPTLFKTTRPWKCFPSLSIETNFYRSSRRVDLKNSRKHDIWSKVHIAATQNIFQHIAATQNIFQHIAATQNIFQHTAATQNIFQHIAATQNRTFEAKYILQLHKTWHLKQSTYCSHTKHDTWSKVHIAATQNMTFGAKYFTYVLYNVLYILQLHKIIFSPADQPYFPNFNPAVEFFLKV